MNKPAGLDRFTVDTHIFRELGELLVGRDSTALVELIKNAYDADATRVDVHAEALDDAEGGNIVVSDDGVGMNPHQFRLGFLRIAARMKEHGSRRSVLYGRRYTGAKGVGRLAAHKLARRLTVHSVPLGRDHEPREGVEAHLDWDLIEAADSVDTLSRSALDVRPTREPPRAAAGTQIRLERLRHKWTAARRQAFIAEVQTFRAPPMLTQALPKTAVTERLLFDEPHLRDAQDGDPGFVVNLTGEFAGGEAYLHPVVNAASWILEIRAERGSGKVEYAISPTSQAQAEGIFALQKHTDAHPNPTEGPFFEARILLKVGRTPTAVESVWRRISGIRVFLEGFRVLPYGESGNDWLGIDRIYAARTRELQWLPGGEREGVDPDAGLVWLPNNAYFGAIFLTESGADSLAIVVNREGFIENEALEHLRNMVRGGVALLTRTRAAAELGARAARRIEREPAQRPTDVSSSKLVAGALLMAREKSHEARALLAAGQVQQARSAVTAALRGLSVVSEAAEELSNERRLLRVLASLGTQMAAFIHEIQNLLQAAESIEGAFQRLRAQPTVSPRVRSQLRELEREVSSLRRAVERQGAYLLDVVTPDARRRRGRHVLRDALDAGVRLVASSAERLEIAIENDIPEELRSPLMFRAELTTIFGNLLTNAVKAAGAGGRIRAAGRRHHDRTLVTIENTGAAVDLRTAEQWFLPFISSTARVDPVLGQGMGMGLTITRNMLAEHGATIRFVKPTRPFKTAVEVALP